MEILPCVHSPSVGEDLPLSACSKIPPKRLQSSTPGALSLFWPNISCLRYCSSSTSSTILRAQSRKEFIKTTTQANNVALEVRAAEHAVCCSAVCLRDIRVTQTRCYSCGLRRNAHVSFHEPLMRETYYKMSG